MRDRRRLTVTLSTAIAVLIAMMLQPDGGEEERRPAGVRSAQEVSDAIDSRASPRGPASARASHRVTTPGETPESITVRDLADGSPVAGLHLTLESGSLVTGPDGTAASLRLESGDERPTVGSPFLFGGWSTDDDRRTLWVYRRVRVSGTVRVPEGTRCDSIRVQVAVAPGGPGQLPNDAPVPWSKDWMRAADLDRREPPVRVEESGSFATTCPRVKGLVVVASSDDPRARPDIRRLEVSSAIEDLSLALEINEATVVRGKVLPPEGEELSPHTRVTVHVACPMNRSKYDMALMAMYGQAVAGGGKNVPGEDSVWDIRVITSARVERSGEFIAQVFAQGPLMIVAESAGCFPERRFLGETSSSMHGIHMPLRAKGVPRAVLITDDGSPLRRASVTIADGNAEVGLPALGPYTTSDVGELETTAFVVGGQYYLIWNLGARDSGPTDGWITWNNQEKIDVRHDLRSER